MFGKKAPLDPDRPSTPTLQEIDQDISAILNQENTSRDILFNARFTTKYFGKPFGGTFH